MPTATAPHPIFAAGIDGIDISRPVPAAGAAWISDALDRWPVLVLPGQTVTDQSRVASSAIFGPLETTRSGANRAGGTPIEQLMAFAGNPGFVYAHRWNQGDVVVWDNRAVMHRATPFASTTERRRMVRTTASCPPSVQ